MQPIVYVLIALVVVAFIAYFVMRSRNKQGPAGLEVPRPPSGPAPGASFTSSPGRSVPPVVQHPRQPSAPPIPERAISHRPAPAAEKISAEPTASPDKPTSLPAAQSVHPPA